MDKAGKQAGNEAGEEPQAGNEARKQPGNEVSTATSIPVNGRVG